MTWLLLITEDGRGKRVRLDDIRRTNRKAMGVTVSSVPLAVSLIAEDLDDELILMSRLGKV